MTEPVPVPLPDVAGAWDCHVHLFDATRPVQAGHYQPATKTLADIEALAAAHGVHHLVLVQPSVYGGDNRLMLEALAQSANARHGAAPGRHRGVVVLDARSDATLTQALSDASLDAMHAVGVRGARLNLVSPVGDGAGRVGGAGGTGGADGHRSADTSPSPADTSLSLEARFARMAPRLRARGWHVQWYATAAQLPRVLALHQAHPVDAVLDHLAGMATDVASDDAAWQALAGLADLGAWVKLSGWYRLGAPSPADAAQHAAAYATLVPHIQRVAGMFQGRLLWGSDWPHTGRAASNVPPYAATWSPVEAALGQAGAQAARAGGAKRYV